jgi:hypothetical protein
LISLFLSNRLDAQIIYTDIPDATPNATYPLDLNNDNIVDFLIQFDLGDKLMCKPQNDNAYSGYYFDNVYLPWANPTNTSICDTLTTWYDTMNPGTMASGTNMGYWIGATDKFLALKLIVGSEIYYGWARLDVTASSTSFTIKDYAYESTPNKCILSGQTKLGLNKNLNHTVLAIFPNPCNSKTTIKTTNNFKNTTITIQNTYGKIVKQLKNITDQTISLSIDNIPSGLYFIALQENNKVIAVEKLIITD